MCTVSKGCKAVAMCAVFHMSFRVALCALIVPYRCAGYVFIQVEQSYPNQSI